MKIAVVGKGGSGKTTTAAVIARTFARSGQPTLALDCDCNPNLGISLGIGEEATERLVSVRAAVDAGDEPHASSADDLVERFGAEAPDGVRLAVVSAIEHPEPGCPCCGISPEQLLGELVRADRLVVADFEGGLGTVLRLAGKPVDVMVVVVEPTGKSIEVGRRAVEAVQDDDSSRVVIVANRVRDDEDADRVRAAFPGRQPVLVPDDPAIVAAEREGRAPLDAAPDAPALRALVGLAESLLPTLAMTSSAG